MSLNTSLANHFLVAMPSLRDPKFKKSVIFICEHHMQGTVGLIINHPMEHSLSLVFDQLNIQANGSEQQKKPLLFGGPSQPERGFVIHRPLGEWRSSIALFDNVTITTSNDIIRAIAKDRGPKDALVALGYVSWSENQLEKEVIENHWLVCPCRPELLYEVPFKERWEYAGLTLGVKMNQLTSSVGHA